jgi:hypothetical protein
MQEGGDLRDGANLEALNNVLLQTSGATDVRTEVTTDIADRNLVTGFILRYSRRKCYFEMSEEFPDDVVIVTSRKTS